MGVKGFKATLKQSFPTAFQRWLLLKRFRVGHRLDPVRRSFGLGAGQCIDRYYIEQFLNQYATDIVGEVLEFQDNTYTARFGGNRVTKSDVLDIDPANSQATIIGDLASAASLPSNRFDCIIATQVLQYPYDVRAAVRTLYQMLKPGGTILATLPGIAQISQQAMAWWGDNWRFTSLSARTLFAESFGSENVEVKVHGNVLTATAFLHGVVADELDPSILDHEDFDYELLITARAIRAI